ncbi:MAG: bifunctional oligoribonuclease/PAP phosphatase NrnA [Clostridia bacterium]|nr:bifunctional oligoribonuclease/PAP phosphatase NrnA [Clostridia bacterium]
MFEAILREIQNHDTIIIHRHYRPDGDALGSQFGLKYILEANFPHKTVYAVGDDPGNYRFIGGGILDDIPNSAYEGALAIILDSGAASRISDDRYRKAACTARIDHHIFTGKIADAEVIDSTYESCCGLITEFAVESNLTIPAEAAKALYTGMVTDSGRFRYDGTSSRTHRLAARLREENFDTNDIYRNLYADDYENKKRKAQFILKVQFTENRVAYIYTTKEEVREMGISVFSASRGMVNTMADIRGTDIWVNFTEDEEGILCEIRSGGPNINPIAVKYGGGGHAKASGATVPDFETAMAMLRDLNEMAGG